MALGLVALGALMAGCWPGDPFEPDLPCECPNTERIVSSIDWLGDGTPADSVESSATGQEGKETPQVRVSYASVGSPLEAAATVEDMLRRAQEGGLTARPNALSDYIVIQVEESRAEIHAPFVGTENPVLLNISMRVNIFVEDSGASEALQPFVDAFGTID